MSISHPGSNIQCVSINKNSEVKMVTTLSITSCHKHSILAFRTLEPVKKLQQFSPLYQTVNSPTATFSPSLSALTLDGYPYLFVAF